MSPRQRAVLALVTGALFVWAAPLVGLVAAGRPVAEFLAFPPRTAHVAHAPFSWTAFILISIVAWCAVWLFVAAARRPRLTAAAPLPTRGRFPWWGWLGLALAAAGWLSAWSDAVPAEWRRHTFTPLWLGYGLVMNALTWRRSGRCPLTHRTGWFLALFPVSALFWWLFEHLNRFVGNWYYTGIASAGDLDYFVQGSLPFSTVLPAVTATASWLATFQHFDSQAPFSMHGHPSMAWVALLAGTLALAGVGIWTETLFSALWLGPLAIFLGLQQILTGATALAPVASGDWRPLLQPALAGLTCGFFWELWNYGSLAQWHYSIPYVQRFHVFEMPVLGYAGYLPFGILCAVVADLVAGIVKRGAVASPLAAAPP